MGRQKAASPKKLDTSGISGIFPAPRVGTCGNQNTPMKIDPTELPAEFRLLSSAPTLAAWQYTARDFTIGAKVEWYEQGETVDQIVDFLKLSTHVSRDGQWVTDSRFFVKSKGRANLRAILPAETSLWEARVDGTPVNARRDRKVTLIPLPAPATRRPSRCVVLKRTLRRRPESFIRWVIAHELAHAHLRNGGRWPEEDPEVAADGLAADWGFPKP